MKQFCIKSLLAGVFIGLACLVYLNVGGVAGACLFAFGLLGVVVYGLNLYTGKAGLVDSWRAVALLFGVILPLNIVGCYVASHLAGAEAREMARHIVDVRLGNGPLRNLFLSMPCGVIMYTAVRFAKQGQMLPLLFGVPLFILCGFPHCIADTTYYFAAGALNGDVMVDWLSCVAGNFAGCNLMRVVRDEKEKQGSGGGLR